MSDRIVSYLNNAKCTDEHWNRIFDNKSSHTAIIIDDTICSKCKVKKSKNNIYKEINLREIENKLTELDG